MNSTKRSVLLVTGMSGAGRTAAVKALEDLGYEAVDNLPLNFIVPLLRSAAIAEDGGPAQPIVLAVDIRTRDFDENSFIRTVDQLASDSDLDQHRNMNFVQGFSRDVITMGYGSPPCEGLSLLVRWVRSAPSSCRRYASDTLRI